MKLHTSSLLILSVSTVIHLKVNAQFGGGYPSNQYAYPQNEQNPGESHRYGRNMNMMSQNSPYEQQQFPYGQMNPSDNSNNFHRGITQRSDGRISHGRSNQILDNYENPTGNGNGFSQSYRKSPSSHYQDMQSPQLVSSSNINRASVLPANNEIQSLQDAINQLWEIINNLNQNQQHITNNYNKNQKNALQRQGGALAYFDDDSSVSERDVSMPTGTGRKMYTGGMMNTRQPEYNSRSKWPSQSRKMNSGYRMK